MPTWTFDELQDCQQQMFPTLNYDLISELFDRFGGVSIYVLGKASNISDSLQRLEEDGTIEKAKTSDRDKNSLIIRELSDDITNALNKSDVHKLLNFVGKSNHFHFEILI